MKKPPKRLPKVISTSVIRSSHQGESHGGVYIVDLESGKFKQVIDWNDSSINWEGRGADRGLRGIAFYNDHVYLAASDEIFVYTKEFKKVKSIKNKYLKHCHEIYINNHKLYLTSTGFDSILVYDLKAESFIKGYNLKYSNSVLKILKIMKALKGDWINNIIPEFKPKIKIFNPNEIFGPEQNGFLHINNVFFYKDSIYLSGTKINLLIKIDQGTPSSVIRLPFGTHNVQKFEDGYIFNHTASNHVVYVDKNGKDKEAYQIKKYDYNELTHTDLPKDHARPSFGRGLCITDNGLIIGGSSPATISAYKQGQTSPLKTINITSDVRNAIHGLEIWPFD